MIFYIFMCAILSSYSVSASTPFVIKVDKSDSTLLIENNNGEEIKKFSIATGRGGEGDKKEKGDKKIWADRKGTRNSRRQGDAPGNIFEIRCPCPIPFPS